MANKRELDIVISAQDLSEKKLAELADSLDKIAAKNDEITASGKASATSMAELRVALENLQAVQKQLKGRIKVFEGIEEDEAEARKLEKAILESKNALAKLESEAASTGKTTKKLANDLEKAATRVSKTELAFASLTNRIRESRVEQERISGTTFADAQRETSEALARTNGEIAKTITLQKELTVQAAKESDAEKERAAAIRESAEAKRKQREEEQKSIAALREAAAAQERVNAERAEAAAKEAQLNAEYQQSLAVQARLLRVMERLGLVAKGTADAYIKNSAAARQNAEAAKQNATAQNQSAAAMARAGTSAKNAANSQELFADRGKKALSVYQRVRGQVLAMASAYVGLYSAITAGQRAFNVSNERIALQTRLLVANGDNVRKAKEDFDFLRSEADRLGFSLNDLGSVYSKLAIAGRAAGLQTEEVRQIFTNFSEVSRVNNLGIEETGRVFKALEQILSKGKIQAEEIRGQLGDVLGGAFTVLAKSLGLSNAQLDKALEKGTVSSRALLGFSQEYASTVNGQLVPATQTLRAELGRLNTAFDDFLLVVAEQGLNDAVRDVSAELRAFFASDEGAEAARDIADAVRLLGEGLLLVAKNLDVVIPLVKLFIAGFAVQALKNISTLLVAIWANGKFLISVLAGLVRGTLTLRTAMIALSVATGPVGIALAAIGFALGYLILRTNDATEATNSYAEEAERAAKATKTANDQAAASALEAVKAEREHKEALDAVTKARTALDKAPKGDLAEARKTREKAEAELARAEATLRTRDAIVARSKALAAQKLEDLRDMRERNEQLLIEAQNRLKAAEATLAQAEAEQALREARLQESTGGRTLDLNAGLLAKATSDAKAAKKALADARQEVLKLQTSLATGSSGPKSRFANGEKPVGATAETVEIDEKEAKKRADAIERVREEALQSSIRLRQDALQLELKQDEENLAAKLELIRIEYEAKLRANENLAQRQRELGLTAEAAATEAQNAEILRQQRHEEALVRQEYIENRIASARKATLDEIKAKEEAIDRLVAERDQKIEALELQKSLTGMSEEEAARRKYEIELAYQDRVRAKVDALRKIILDAQKDGSLSLKDALALDETLSKLDETSNKIAAIDPAIERSRQLSTQFVDGVAGAFGTLATGFADFLNGVGSIKDAFKNAGDAFRNFLADFLIGIGQMILKALLFKTLFGVDGQSGPLSAIFKGLGGLTGHTGGIVGHSGLTPKAVNPAWFVGAKRFHSGGFPGLRQDEVPAVLLKGEEVLTRTDPRNALNGGGAGQSQKIEINNMIETDSFAVALGQSQTFKKVVHNVLRADKAAVRQLLA